MSITDSPRFINTPTLLEEYNADQKGYDDLIDEDTKFALSKEYDKVSGNEQFYQAIFSHVSLPNVTVVSGNEGFMEQIKKGVSSLIQAVKDFFKWIFSFFTGKKEIAKRKQLDLRLKIEKDGVTTEEVQYPLDYTDIYNKKGKTDNNLAWMPLALNDCEKAIDRVENYIKVLESASKEMTEGLMHTDTSDKVAKLAKMLPDTVEKSRAALGIAKLNEPAVFFGLNDFQMDPAGKLKELPDPPNQTKNPKFRTDQTQVVTLLTLQEKMLKSAEGMMENSVKLEKSFLRELNTLAKVSEDLKFGNNPELKKVAGELQAFVRNAMANLKMMELIIFRTAFGALSILNATARKGSAHAA